MPATRSAPPDRTKLLAQAFADYLSAARGCTGLWRVATVLILLLVFQFALSLIIIAAAVAIDPAAANKTFSAEAQTVITLAVWAATPLALALALRWVHGRTLSSVMGRRRPFDLGAMTFGAIAVVFYTAVGVALASFLGFVAVEPVQDYRPFWGFLILAMLLVPLQAAAEELIFRGYLLQEIGIRASHPVCWAVLPSALFAFLHFSGGEPTPEALSYVASTFVFGLFAAALVYRTAGLSAAIGMHAMNNLLALCLFSPPQGVAGFGPIGWRYLDGGLYPSLLLQSVLLGVAIIVLWKVLPDPEGAERNQERN